MLDERMVHLLYRALARDPQERYVSAVQMREALDDFLSPESPAPSADGRQSTIEFLLRRMRHKSDFPALSESVGAINSITSSETQSISDVSNTILKDFSLTNKILRWSTRPTIGRPVVATSAPCRARSLCSVWTRYATLPSP
jgi:serine/threonine protein kinase